MFKLYNKGGGTVKHKLLFNPGFSKICVSREKLYSDLNHSLKLFGLREGLFRFEFDMLNFEVWSNHKPNSLPLIIYPGIFTFLCTFFFQWLLHKSSCYEWTHPVRGFIQTV